MKLYVYNGAAFDLWVELGRGSDGLCLAVMRWDRVPRMLQVDARLLAVQGMGNWDVDPGTPRDPATGVLIVELDAPATALAMTVTRNGWRGADVATILAKN